MATESVNVQYPFLPEETRVSVKGFERKYLDISEVLADAEPKKRKQKKLLDQLWLCEYVSKRYNNSYKDGAAHNSVI